MPNPIQVTLGKRYGRLTIVCEAPRRLTSAGRPIRVFQCHCDCGTTVDVSLSDLRSGHTSSCGCLHRQVVAKLGRSNATHGMTDSLTWKSWKSMLDRCYGEHRTDNHNYKARGIIVCERWRHSFEAFLADMGERPSRRHSIERIDNDGHYEPGNCCWATPEQQGRNRRTNHNMTMNGQTMCLKDWANKVGIRETTLWARLKAGWSIEKSLSAPVRKRRTT